ncbi:MAG: hypothetical protein IT236_05085 [Bacteroidia bacterium]|nr:hypothetical protein [Bacteroidia bacterium]
MNIASKILFEDRYGSEKSKLFSSKADLAYSLLTSENSQYRLTDTEITDSNIYTRQMNRIQSYISQIFSGTGTRKITNEFKDSMRGLIESKLLNIPEVNSEEIYNKVIKSLEDINLKQLGDLNNSYIKVSRDFIADFTNSNFVAIFSSRPLELEANPSEPILQIRNLIVEGICSYFTSAIPSKKYRYNFPTHQIGILFWRRISYLLIKKLNSDSNAKSSFNIFMADLYSQSENLKSDFENQLKHELIQIKDSETEVERMRTSINHFLFYLNENALFQVFESKEPVFITPHIVMNPNESNNLKGYLFLEKSNNSLELYKLAQFDLNTWKEKVWDTIKANKNTRLIPFVKSIEDNIFLNFQ